MRVRFSQRPRWTSSVCASRYSAGWRAASSGGKALRQEGLGGLYQSGLVVPNRRHVIGAVIVENDVDGLVLGVERVGADQTAGELGLGQQLAHGDDFTVVFLHRHHRVDPLAGLANGPHQRAAIGPAQGLAIKGDVRIGVWAQRVVLPLQQQRLNGGEIQIGQGTLESAFRRHPIAGGVGFLWQAAQGPALGSGQLLGKLGDRPLAQVRAGQLGQNDDPQDRAPRLIAAMTIAGIGYLRQPIQQALDALGRGAEPFGFGGEALLRKRSARPVVAPPATPQSLWHPEPAPTVVWAAHAVHNNPRPLVRSQRGVPTGSNPRPCKRCRERVGQPRNSPPR